MKPDSPDGGSNTAPDRAGGGQRDHRWRSRIALLAFVFGIYCCGYGVARWRKCIIMTESRVDLPGILRRTAPGVGDRGTSIGRFKNRTNRALFLVFRPLSALEDVVRGGLHPLPR